jgi:hypothetical protein
MKESKELTTPNLTRREFGLGMTGFVGVLIICPTLDAPLPSTKPCLFDRVTGTGRFRRVERSNDV